MSTQAAPNEVLATELPGVVLRRLTAADAEVYRSVVRGNAAHLGHEDDGWHDELAATTANLERARYRSAAPAAHRHPDRRHRPRRRLRHDECE